MDDTNQFLELSHSCKFINYKWAGLELEYTEYSSDHWHSNTETSIDIDIEKAKKIVVFLEKVFSTKLSDK